MITWKLDHFRNADAEKVHNEICSIGESVSPQQIVEFARNENTELHKCFDWNDSTAAEKWRLHEARQIVCNLVFEEQNASMPAIRTIQLGDSGYVPVRLMVTHKDEYQNLLARAKAELRAFKLRYKNLVELEEILALID